MSLKDWFESKRKIKKNNQLDATALNAKLTDEDICSLWRQCVHCKTNLPTKVLLDSQQVCPECQYHFRVGARERIEHLCDQFEEWDVEMRPLDPLTFTDTQPYLQRQADALKKSKLNEAIVTGQAQIDGYATALGVMDFDYLGGSMGSVVGEKITRLVERAIEKQLPLVIVSASGGARMQEGTFSLMQMVKTSAALAKYHEKGLLYISILTEPTFGGVTASFGTLGDIILAEEGARIGFAGRRVIEQTIRQKLPADFQTAGYLLKYGQVDHVIHRHQMKETLSHLFRLHQLEPVSPSGDEQNQPQSVGTKGGKASNNKKNAPEAVTGVSLNMLAEAIA